MDRAHFEGEYRYTLVCVDSYEDRILCGRLYNPLRQKGVCFSGVVELVSVLEELLDELNVPQQQPGPRSFCCEHVQAEHNQTEIGQKPGARGTFQIRILYRQNASWQGSVLWVDENRTEAFRSTMELLLLMDSALRKK